MKSGFFDTFTKIYDLVMEYEEKIPEPFYSRLKIAMYNYKVEIDD